MEVAPSGLDVVVLRFSKMLPIFPISNEMELPLLPPPPPESTSKVAAPLPVHCKRAEEGGTVQLDGLIGEDDNPMEVIGASHTQHNLIHGSGCLSRAA